VDVTTSRETVARSMSVLEAHLRAAPGLQRE
jgi:hypothetical protein